MNVQDKVIEIVAEQGMLEVSDITPTSTLDELGIDSLGLVECIFAIEETFDVEVPFNSNDPDASEFNFNDIASMSSAIENLIKEQSQT